MEHQFPIRKPTRLKCFDYSRSGTYFLTICTIKKRNLLSKIVGDGAHDVPKIVLTKAGKIVETYISSTNNIQNVNVENYVIMPNHIHMIIRIYPDEKENGTSWAPSPTNQLIPHIISTFKRFCNAQYGENLFQRSYHDHIIRNAKEYEHIWNYIQLNPSRWQYDCFYNPES